MRRKITTLLLVLAIIVTMLPTAIISVFADESGTTEKNITLGANALQGAQKSNVYYGTYKQSSDNNGGYNVDPIKWRVLSNGDGKLFLLADQNLDVFKYNTAYVDVTWETSTMRSWLNGYEASKNGQNTDYTSDNFIKTAFSTQELAYILQTTLENADNPDYNTEGGNNTDDYVFLLSIADVLNTAYGFTADTNSTDTRVSTNTAYVAAGGKLGTSNMYGVGAADYWWLRSPGRDSDDAAFVTYNGRVDVGGDAVDYNGIAVRPAFNLNLSSVLFTSAAKGGKSSISANAEIGTLTDNDGYKLTLLDSSRSGFSAEILKTADKTFVKYQGATTGTNEYITAMIVNASGEVTYYGSLKNITETADASGTIEIDLSGMNSGDKLYILNEQWNGNYKTDYASALNEVTVPTDVNAYNVSFNANGGTGAMGDVVVKSGDSYTLPKCGFTYAGYSFKGWSSTADGEIIDTDFIEITNVTTLYAIWTSNSDLIAQLDKAIEDLEEAMKDSDKDLSDKITALTKSLNDAKTALEKADTDNKAELTDKIDTAQSTLQSAIDKVADDLEQAITDLNEAISNGDTELNGKITELQNAIGALEAVKDNYVSADTALKTELESAIATAKSEAITAATKLVNDAKEELNAAIDKKADTETVNAAIKNLQDAIDALEDVKDDYVAADTALKAELEEEINALKDRIAELESRNPMFKVEDGKLYVRYDETEEWTCIGTVQGEQGEQGIQGEKGEKGDTGATGADGLAIAATAIGGAALVSNIALIVYMIIKKKKLI